MKKITSLLFAGIIAMAFASVSDAATADAAGTAAACV